MRPAGSAARGAIRPLKRRFVGRDEVVDLIALAVVAGEHLFLYGPPGTAKSALIRQFATAVQGRYFEYLLTRFSEPNEVFGPIDLVRLREGTVATVTTGMLPEAEFVFLDELFNANSAILNNLLSVLNERVYRRGAEVHRLPLLSLFSASNHLPEDDALRALFDRFLLRCHVDTSRERRCPGCWRPAGSWSGRAPRDPRSPPPTCASCRRASYRVDLAAVPESLRRRGPQGARPGRRDVRPPRRQGAQNWSRPRPCSAAARPRTLRPLGPPLRLGPRGADRPARRPGAGSACRPSRGRVVPPVCYVVGKSRSGMAGQRTRGGRVGTAQPPLSPCWQRPGSASAPRNWPTGRPGSQTRPVLPPGRAVRCVARTTGVSRDCTIRLLCQPASPRSRSPRAAACPSGNSGSVRGRERMGVLGGWGRGGGPAPPGDPWCSPL